MRQPIGLISLNCLYHYSQQGLRKEWDSNPHMTFLPYNDVAGRLLSQFEYLSKKWGMAH